MGKEKKDYTTTTEAHHIFGSLLLKCISLNTNLYKTDCNKH